MLTAVGAGGDVCVCPWQRKVLIDERDEFMFRKLLGCQGKVVAVVGLGHLDGIEERWKRRFHH